MPAVRKPTAVLEANGSFENHPNRARPHEPDTGRGIGPAPAFVPEELRPIWDEIVGMCAPGVFQSSDAVFMAGLVALVGQWRDGPKDFGIQRYNVLLTYLSRAGMTPADRSRVFVPKQADSGKEKRGLASFR